MKANTAIQAIPPGPVALGMCNFMDDTAALREFAIENHFDGIDWSFRLEDLPKTPAAASAWVKSMKALFPLEIRYHCPFFPGGHRP